MRYDFFSGAFERFLEYRRRVGNCRNEHDTERPKVEYNILFDTFSVCQTFPIKSEEKKSFITFFTIRPIGVCIRVYVFYVISTP